MKIGYLRVSTEEQRPDRQIDGLAPLCDELHIEKCSAVAKNRPIFADVLGKLKRGDTLVVSVAELAAENDVHPWTLRRRIKLLIEETANKDVRH